MSWTWVVIITALLTFCIWQVYGFFKFTYMKGYKRGAEDVLEEWKKYMKDWE